MERLNELFDESQLKAIEHASSFLGTRHPVWFPLFHNKRPMDVLVHSAVSGISVNPAGMIWLRDLVPRLTDVLDASGSSSALAEVRAYGGLLECGFSVSPIPRTDDSTPDFNVDAGDGEMTVEVFAKHQDKDEDDTVALMGESYGPFPDTIHRSHRMVQDANKQEARELIITTAAICPGGVPDSSKPGDSVQANLISRICGVKKNECQIPGDKPAVLIIDFCHFGGPDMSSFTKVDQAFPIVSGHRGITSGALWYAVYGWKNTPVFQEGHKEFKRMGHDGRFRLAGDRKSKLSAVLMVLNDCSVLLENPWATKRLTHRARMKLCRYPWFDLSHSIADFHTGDCDTQLQIHHNVIECFESNNPNLEII